MLSKHDKNILIFSPSISGMKSVQGGNVGLQQQAGAAWWLSQRGRAAENS